MALANRDPEEIRSQLQTWLAERVPGATITSCHVPSASGMSNLTVLFDAQWPDGDATATAEYVARIAPDGPTVFPSYDLGKEAKVMNALASAGVSTPIVRWVEEDTAVLGVPFLVMDRAQGKVAGDDPPFTAAGWVLDLSAQEQARLCTASLQAMASVNRADWRALGLGFLATGGESADAVYAADLAYWQKFYDWARGTDVNPTVEAGLDWLAERKPAGTDPVLLWGDSRIGNMLFDDSQTVSAILDWEMVGLGQAEADLAWWLFLLRHHTEGIGMPMPAGFPTRDVLVSTYEEALGRPVVDLDWYEVWAAVRLSIVMHRAGNLMIELGLLPADAPMKYANPASMLLATLIGAPAPGAEAQSFIGNR